MNHEIQITETLCRVVTVNAANTDAAVEQVRMAYHDEDIVLDSNDLLGTEFTVVGEDESETNKRAITDTERLDVAMNLLDSGQLDKYATKCEALENN